MVCLGERIEGGGTFFFFQLPAHPRRRLPPSQMASLPLHASTLLAERAVEAHLCLLVPPECLRTLTTIDLTGYHNPIQVNAVVEATGTLVCVWNLGMRAKKIGWWVI